MTERKQERIQARKIEQLLVAIQAKYQEWLARCDQEVDSFLDIRNEFNQLGHQGERGQVIASDWEWALAFAPA